jgi:hypothetical protein
MKITLLLALLTLCVLATAQANNGEKPSVPSGTGQTVDPKVHADAIKLVEVSDAKQNLHSNLRSMVEQGKKVIMEKCQTCAPEFGEEWEKRMVERLNVDDFVTVYVHVYEKYFTDAELTELIELQKQKKNSQPVNPSPELKKKLESVMPSLMADSVGECTRVGAKLGPEIGAEIEREHPEYTEQQSKAR